MPRPIRVLTTDRVPAYLHALATIDPHVARFDVLVPDDAGLEAWWARQRELPPAMRAVRPIAAERALLRGAYDVVLAHGVADLTRLAGARAEVVLVLHESQELLEVYGDGIGTWPPRVREAMARVCVVFASDAVAASWRLEGVTIPLAVDPGDWPVSDMSRHAAVTVAPFAVERAILDVSFLLAQVSAAVPLTMLGLNPGLRIESETASRARRRDTFSTHRLYLNLAHPQLEGPHPSAMLEAMAAGLPVVTLRHDQSPVVEAVNGFQCGDVHSLCERAVMLLDDPLLATRLGNAARQTVHARFGTSDFAERWLDLLEALRAQTTRRIA